MKQVRLYVSAAAMLLASMLFADNQGLALRSAVVSHHSSNLTLPRAHASLAIDTYGYFDIRVWVDGMLINRRPQAYVEIPSLRAGRRVVDIEVLSHRGSRMVTKQMYIQPHRWNLYEVEQLGRRGWVSINAVHTQPMGFYYVGGRRQSVRVGYRPPVLNHGVRVNIHHHGKKGKGHGYKKENQNKKQNRNINRSEGRQINRGGNQPITNDRDSHQPRNGGSRSRGG